MHHHIVSNLKVRPNSTWIVMTHGTTHETEHSIDHLSRLARFDMPVAYTTNTRRLANTKKDAAVFYNRLQPDGPDTEMDIAVRIINANDWNPVIVDAIPYAETFLAGTYCPMSHDSYAKRRIFGH